MQPGSITAAAHDFAYRDFEPRFADSQPVSGRGHRGIGNGRAISLAHDAVDAAGPAHDTFRPTSRAAKFLDHVPLHSAAPGAADRIVQALGDDTEAVDNFLRTLELLEPFGPRLVRAFIKAVARGIERASEAAVPPEPAPVPPEPVQQSGFSVQLARLDFRLEVFSASSELRYGPAGFSYTQNVQYASITVRFLSLSASGAFSQEADPLQIEIEGNTISAPGLALEPSPHPTEYTSKGGESSLAPEIREAILDSAKRINGLLVDDRQHTAGADEPSPLVARPPAGSTAASIQDIFQSLTEGFTPGIRLHI